MKHLTQRELKSAGVGGSRYDAKVLGAPFPVFLVNGFETKIDPATKKTLTEIHDLPGLLAAVVKARIFHEQKLAGPDLKFIRSALCVKSGFLANMIGVTPEHYCRCEAGTKVMSAAQEKLYRMFVFFCISSKDKSLCDGVERVRTETPHSEKAMKDELDSLRKMFFDMKIDPVRSAKDEMAFVFNRKPRERDEDGDWRDAA